MLVSKVRNFMNSGFVETLGSGRALCKLSVISPTGRKIMAAFS